jgi:hypothetical protein
VQGEYLKMAIYLSVVERALFIPMHGRVSTDQVDSSAGACFDLYACGTGITRRWQQYCARANNDNEDLLIK